MNMNTIDLEPKSNLLSFSGNLYLYLLYGNYWKTSSRSFLNESWVFRLSHDVVTYDVDRDVSTAYC